MAMLYSTATQHRMTMPAATGVVLLWIWISTDRNSLIAHLNSINGSCRENGASGLAYAQLAFPNQLYNILKMSFSSSDLKSLLLLLLLAAALVTPAQPARADESARLNFSGVILDQGNNPLLESFTRWLAKKADYPLTTAYTENYQAITDDLHQHPSSLAWTCGAPFVEDHASDGQILVAVPLFHGRPTYHSITITRAGRTEKSLLDFKGQVLAYSDPRSNSGFVAPAFALHEHGIDIHKHFRLLLYTGLHEASIDAVLVGLADVANVDEYILVQYLASHPQARGKLIQLKQYGPFPFTPIVAGRATPPETVKRLQQALLNMAHDAEGKQILVRLGLDGFVIKPASFYQPIADMLQAIKQ